MVPKGFEFVKSVGDKTETFVNVYVRFARVCELCAEVAGGGDEGDRGTVEEGGGGEK